MSKNREKKERERKKHLERLRRKRAQREGTPPPNLLESFRGNPNVKIVPGIPGLPKMSEQLLAFIEPYEAAADTDEAYQKLIQIAVIAWNVALLPPEQRPEALLPFVRSISEEVNQNSRDFVHLVAALMQRKDTEPQFANDGRLIVDFQINETGAKRGHLQVVSALPPP